SLHHPMHTMTLAQRCLCAGLLSLTLASCGGSRPGRPDDGRIAGPGSSTSTTSPASTSSTTVTSDPKSAVIAGYLAYWKLVNSYGAEAGAFDPVDFKNRFSAVASGAQYDSLFNTFQLNRAQGLVYRGGENDQLRPKVVELAADRAVVEDCADDTGGIFSLRDNTFTRPTTPGKHSLIRAVLRPDGGTWKVSTQDGGTASCTP
ncbi:MAG TPA: hypothetical protein VHL53_21630, partial [Acidimicrobiia bacterium]|nr:hypothetical protein [Acidimicrobiia bacterium]